MRFNYLKTLIILPFNHLPAINITATEIILRHTRQRTINLRRLAIPVPIVPIQKCRFTARPLTWPGTVDTLADDKGRPVSLYPAVICPAQEASEASEPTNGCR